MRVAIAALLGLCLFPSLSVAQPHPVGDTVSVFGSNRRPDIAFDSTNQVYLAVAPAGSQIFGRFVNSAGIPLAGAFPIGTTNSQQAPRVAYSPQANAFLVIYCDYRFNELGRDWSKLFGRVVQFAPGGGVTYLSSEFIISTTLASLNAEKGPAVAYSSVSGVFMTTWHESQGTNIFAQRVSNSGALVGGQITVAASAAWEGEPDVTYNPTRDEFLVVYDAELAPNVTLAMSVPVRASDGAVLSAPIGAGAVSPFTTVARVQYDPNRQRYLLAWFTLPTSGFLGRFLMPDGTPDPASGVFPLALGYGSYDGFDVARNIVSNSYMAVFHGTGAQDAGIEISAAGTPSAVFQTTFSCPTCSGGNPNNQGAGTGNFNPQLTASTTAADWMVVSSRSLNETVTMLFSGTASGPTPGVHMAVTTPANNASITNPFPVAGWALDTRATSGPGVDLIHVYAVPHTSTPATFIGTLPVNLAVPSDVVTTYGSQFSAAGWGTSLANLAPGQYTMVFYPRSAVTGQFDFNNVGTAEITISGGPVTAIETPTFGATLPNGGVNTPVTGWAVKMGAPAGTGVSDVHVWAVEANTGASTFLGHDYGRISLGATIAFGPQFTNSGFQVTITNPLPPGFYFIIAYSLDTQTNTFNFGKLWFVIVQ